MWKSPLFRLARATGPGTSFMATSPPEEASESPLEMREGAMALWQGSGRLRAQINGYQGRAREQSSNSELCKRGADDLG